MRHIHRHVSPPFAASNPLLVWWRADVGVVASGGMVTSIADLSPNGNNVSGVGIAGSPTLVAADPQLNNQASIDLAGDGLTQFVHALVQAQPCSIFFVGYPKAIVNGGFFLDGDLNREALFIDGTKLAYYAGNVVDSSYTPVVNTAFAAAATFNGSSSALYVDGALVASGNPGANSLSQIDVGAHVNLHFRFAELRIWAGSLSANDVGALHVYSHQRYGTP